MKSTDVQTSSMLVSGAQLLPMHFSVAKHYQVCHNGCMMSLQD